jgi:hypothetical protein
LSSKTALERYRIEKTCRFINFVTFKCKTSFT